MKTMEVLAQDAYDANQYRGVIGASPASRTKQKAASAEAIARLTEVVESAKALMEDGCNEASHARHSLAIARFEEDV